MSNTTDIESAAHLGKIAARRAHTDGRDKVHGPFDSDYEALYESTLDATDATLGAFRRKFREELSSLLAMRFQPSDRVQVNNRFSDGRTGTVLGCYAQDEHGRDRYRIKFDDAPDGFDVFVNAVSVSAPDTQDV